MREKMILLVEDNPDDEALTLRALKMNNLLNKVMVVRDGVEAIDFLFATGPYTDRDVSHQPELVLLDLNLPKLNGLEVLKRIRDDERTKLLPVVMLTSSDEDCDKVQSYQLGVNSYIQKPVNFEDFTKAVGRLGVYWLALNMGPPAQYGYL